MMVLYVRKQLSQSEVITLCTCYCSNNTILFVKETRVL